MAIWAVKSAWKHYHIAPGVFWLVIYSASEIVSKSDIWLLFSIIWCKEAVCLMVWYIYISIRVNPPEISVIRSLDIAQQNCYDKYETCDCVQSIKLVKPVFIDRDSLQCCWYQ